MKMSFLELRDLHLKNNEREEIDTGIEIISGIGRCNHRSAKEVNKV